MELQYQTGFGNDCATEALPGALPQGRNSPQQCPRPVRRTAVRHRLHRAARREPPFLAVPDPPGAQHKPFERHDGAAGWLSTFGEGPVTPTSCAGAPADPDRAHRLPRRREDLRRQRRPDEQGGVGIHLYAANRSMKGRYFTTPTAS